MNMHISEETIHSFKQLYKDTLNIEITEAQAYEYARDLLSFFKTLRDIDMREYRWKKSLEEKPEGFGFINTGGFSCRLCWKTNREWECWYDENDLKCPPCREAANTNVVPASVMHHRESWWSMDDLKSKLKLHHTTIRKMIRTGELHPRIIKLNGGD